MNAAGIAWNQLLHRLRAAPILPPSPTLPPSSALFVTWRLEGELRGCIGTFSPGPTEQTIREYALFAALEDPRFDPIEAAELPALAATVTLLGDLEPCGLTEWVIGKHGLRAEFPGGYSATFLPEVAEEQGWDHHETLCQLARKAGARTAAAAKIWRYAAETVTMGYEEYVGGARGCGGARAHT